MAAGPFPGGWQRFWHRAATAATAAVAAAAAAVVVAVAAVAAVAGARCPTASRSTSACSCAAGARASRCCCCTWSCRWWPRWRPRSRSSRPPATARRASCSRCGSSTVCFCTRTAPSSPCSSASPPSSPSRSSVACAGCTESFTAAVHQRSRCAGCRDLLVASGEAGHSHTLAQDRHLTRTHTRFLVSVSRIPMIYFLFLLITMRCNGQRKSSQPRFACLNFPLRLYARTSLRIHKLTSLYICLKGTIRTKRIQRNH